MFPPELHRLNVKQGHCLPGPGQDPEHVDTGDGNPGSAAPPLAGGLGGASASLGLGRGSDPNPHSPAPRAAALYPSPLHSFSLPCPRCPWC